MTIALNTHSGTCTPDTENRNGRCTMHQQMIIGTKAQTHTDTPTNRQTQWWLLITKFLLPKPKANYQLIGYYTNIFSMIITEWLNDNDADDYTLFWLMIELKIKKKITINNNIIKYMHINECYGMMVVERRRNDYLVIHLIQIIIFSSLANCLIGRWPTVKILQIIPTIYIWIAILLWIISL